MDNNELAAWQARGVYWNLVNQTGREGTSVEALPSGRPEQVRVTPWPAPVVLAEPQHDGERLVYESFLWDTPQFIGYAAYSLPLPFDGNHRLEADFVAVTPHGVALIEVKGGLVEVNGRPGPSVRWAHFTRSGQPTGGHVRPAQLFRLTDTFSLTARAMTGIDLGPRIGQLMVFPHTSRTQIGPSILSRLYAPDRDFMRIVFAEDLAEFGMWALVADELSRPGIGYLLSGDDTTRLISWMTSELDVRPGPDLVRQEIEAIINPSPKPLSFSKAPPVEEQRRHEGPHLKSEDVRTFLTKISPKPPEPIRKPSRWINKLGIGLAILIAFSIWAGRPSQILAPTPPPASQIVARTPARAAPTPDPIQAALTKATSEPEKRIAAGDKDWVRALGPVTGRPGCQFAEMSYSGKTYNVVACREGDRGVWRY